MRGWEGLVAEEWITEAEVRSPHEGLGVARPVGPHHDVQRVRSPHEGLGVVEQNAPGGDEQRVRSPHEGLGAEMVGLSQAQGHHVRSPREGLGGRRLRAENPVPVWSDYPMRGWETAERSAGLTAIRVRSPHEGLGAAAQAGGQTIVRQVRSPHEGLGARPDATRTDEGPKSDHLMRGWEEQQDTRLKEVEGRQITP